jgi:hypothetical protein
MCPHEYVKFSMSKIKSIGVSLDDVHGDQKAMYTLNTINGVGLSLEQMIEGAKSDMKTKRGVIAGLLASVPLVNKVKQKVQNKIDEKEIETDDARLVLSWLDTLLEEINNSVLLNQRELAVQEGIIEGLSKAVNHCEVLYNQEKQKVNKIYNEALRGNRGPDGRPLKIDEMREIKEIINDENKDEKEIMNELNKKFGDTKDQKKKSTKKPATKKPATKKPATKNN